MTGRRPSEAEPFSLLLPVYARDAPARLRRAFHSTVIEQTRPPDEVVLVQDGPLPAPLADELAALVAASPVPVRVVTLVDNQGLGPALAAGLRAAAHDVVARMDADDVSLAHRFAVQLPLIEAGHDVVGSALSEFEDDENAVVAIRTPPLGAAEIARAARLRQPFHHPTVVYRRSAVHAAGGYQALPALEDYWLFARMIDGGARVANVAEPLLKYRVGAGAYARRGGISLLRSELKLQRRLRGLRFTTRSQFVRNVVVRGGYRLVPEPLRRRGYRLLATRSTTTSPR